jgi:hypothetical protein
LKEFLGCNAMQSAGIQQTFPEEHAASILKVEEGGKRGTSFKQEASRGLLTLQCAMRTGFLLGNIFLRNVVDFQRTT